MYKLGDSVRLFYEGELLPWTYIISRVRGDYELFDAYMFGDPEAEIKHLSREEIMYDYETDKLCELLFEIELLVRSLCDDDDFFEHNENMENHNETSTIMADATLSGLTSNVTGSFKDVDELYKWYSNGQFGYYGNSAVLYSKESKMFFLILQ